MKFVLFILLVAVYLQNDLSSGKPVRGVVQIPEELLGETSRPRIIGRSLSPSGDSFGRFSHLIDKSSLSRSRDQIAADFGKSLQLRRWQNGNESFRSRNEDDLRSTIRQSYGYVDDQPRPRITDDYVRNFRRPSRRSSQNNDDDYWRNPSYRRPSRQTEDDPLPRQPSRNFDQLTRIRSRLADEGIDVDKRKHRKFDHKELSPEKLVLFEKLKKDAKGGIIIEGKKGEIKVDGKIVRSDEAFINEGKIRLRIEDGRIYINDNVVFDNKSSSSSRLSDSAISSRRYGLVSSFVMVVDKDGKIRFIDNNGNQNFDS